VTLPPFYIDRTEVTNAQYKRYCDATGYSTPPHWKDGTYPESEAELPVTHVNWWEASAYAAWAGKRLPTEAEWEKAARGPKSLRWPWANEWQEDCANTEEAKIEHTSPVGIFPQGRSPYGLLDMAGNTWEWTLSRWGMDVLKPDYKYPYTDGSGRNGLSGTHARILRGGSWYDDSRDARCAYRLRDLPDYVNYDFGFRCVVSLAISPS
jgi:eukaryotic-like serine/threonine-protein kinase